MGSIFVEIMNRVKDLYAKNGGAFPEPIIHADYPKKFEAEEVTRRVNGYFTRDTVVNGKEYKKGQLVPGFANLMDDGSTSSMCWVYSGCFSEKDGNLSKSLPRRPYATWHVRPRLACSPASPGHGP